MTKKFDTNEEYLAWLEEQIEELCRLKDDQRRLRLCRDPWSVRNRSERYAPLRFLLRHRRHSSRADREQAQTCFKGLLRVFKEDYRGVRNSLNQWFRENRVWPGVLYRRMFVTDVMFAALQVTLHTACVLDELSCPGACLLAEFASGYIVDCFPKTNLVIIGGGGSYR